MLRAVFTTGQLTLMDTAGVAQLIELHSELNSELNSELHSKPHSGLHRKLQSELN